MKQPIVNYHRDSEQHWVAELACGHNQHVRHQPPLTERQWVTTEAGRQSMLGFLLECKKCDERAGADHQAIDHPVMSPTTSPTAADEDPRIYFAAERTLLAWLRTGIAIIGVGFVVARFGLFIAVLHHPQSSPDSVTGSTIIGTGFVLLGSMVIAAAALQHSRFSRLLTSVQRPSRYWTTFSIIVSVLLSVLGIALGVFLLAGMFG